MIDGYIPRKVTANVCKYFYIGKRIVLNCNGRSNKIRTFSGLKEHLSPFEADGKTKALNWVGKLSQGIEYPQNYEQ